VDDGCGWCVVTLRHWRTVGVDGLTIVVGPLPVVVVVVALLL